jgi:hypothetical protein
VVEPIAYDQIKPILCHQIFRLERIAGVTFSASILLQIRAISSDNAFQITELSGLEFLAVFLVEQETWFAASGQQRQYHLFRFKIQHKVWELSPDSNSFDFVQFVI